MYALLNIRPAVDQVLYKDIGDASWGGPDIVYAGKWFLHARDKIGMTQSKETKPQRQPSSLALQQSCSPYDAKLVCVWAGPSDRRT